VSSPVRVPSIAPSSNSRPFASFFRFRLDNAHFFTNRSSHQHTAQACRSPTSANPCNMDNPQLSIRVARCLVTADISGKHVNPPKLLVRATHPVADMTAGSPMTESSDKSSKVIEDPTAAPQDSTCHFMELPSEIRLSIYEHLFNDFFTRLTADLDPLPGEPQTEHLPSVQELLSALHINHTSRKESIDVCSRIADASSRTASSWNPKSTYTMTYIRIQIVNHVTLRKIQAKHRKIRRILRWTRRNILES
jgi:hypothetical protein